MGLPASRLATQNFVIRRLVFLSHLFFFSNFLYSGLRIGLVGFSFREVLACTKWWDLGWICSCFLRFVIGDFRGSFSDDLEGFGEHKLHEDLGGEKLHFREKPSLA